MVTFVNTSLAALEALIYCQLVLCHVVLLLYYLGTVIVFERVFGVMYGDVQSEITFTSKSKF